MPVTYATPDLYPCDHCGRRFSRREHLERHKRIRESSQQSGTLQHFAKINFDQIPGKSLSLAQSVERAMHAEMYSSDIFSSTMTQSQQGYHQPSDEMSGWHATLVMIAR